MNAFEIIAEPSRRSLMDLLLAGPQPVNDLVAAMDMSQPVVSKHLRILRDAGLVEVTPRGQQRLYSLRDADQLKEIEAWLAPHREYWASRLDALEAYLDTNKEKNDGT